MLLFIDTLLTVTAVCFLITNFSKSALLSKSSHYIKCSKTVLKVFVYWTSPLFCEMIINSSGDIAKVNLSVDIFSHSMSWKLIADVLKISMFPEWHVLKLIEGFLKRSWKLVEEFLRLVKKNSLSSVVCLRDFLKMSWKNLEDVFVRYLSAGHLLIHLSLHVFSFVIGSFQICYCKFSAMVKEINT